jgi:hypothetical protein
MGDVVPAEKGPWWLHAELPSSGSVRMALLRDGVVVAETEARNIELSATEPGTYRVEAYRDDGGRGAPWRTVPWVVSNPIYVWPEAASAAARIHRAPPLPAPPLSQDLLKIADFEANHRDVAHNVVGGSGEGVAWNFRLAEVSQREAFAAMAWRPDPPLDWSAADGMVVSLKSAHPMRARLEFRTEAADGSLESWVHSVKAGPDAVPTAIDWSKFRPPWSEDEPSRRIVDSRHPGPAELRAVRGVFLVVTPVMLAAGSEVEATLHRLGLYGPS